LYGGRRKGKSTAREGERYHNAKKREDWSRFN
jgi:hypothetical protein